MATKLDDFTKAKQATTQEEVDAQDTRTKLYQSLGYTYGQQMEDSDKQYDKAISQQDRAALAKGMQRSSYNLQTQANIQNQKAEARNKLGQAMIADYQKQVTDLEESAANRALQKEQFKATQDYNYAQLAQQKALQEAQMAQTKELTEAQLAQNQSQFESTQGYNYAQLAQQKDLTQAQLAQNQSQFEATQGYNYAQLAQQKLLQEAELAQQKALQEAQLAQNQAQFDVQQAFNEKQWAAQQEQWREQMDYSKMSDRQKLVFNYIETALKNGTDVSDERLAEVGMTRADFNGMQSSSSSGGGAGSEWAKKGFLSYADYVAANGRTATEFYGTGKPAATEGNLETMAEEGTTGGKDSTKGTTIGGKPGAKPSASEALGINTNTNYAKIVGGTNNGTGAASTAAKASTNATGKNVTSAASTKKVWDDTYHDYAYEYLVNSKKK